jgi:hypothetical protein
MVGTHPSPTVTTNIKETVSICIKNGKDYTHQNSNVKIFEISLQKDVSLYRIFKNLYR